MCSVLEAVTEIRERPEEEVTLEDIAAAVGRALKRNGYHFKEKSAAPTVATTTTTETQQPIAKKAKAAVPKKAKDDH